MLSNEDPEMYVKKIQNYRFILKKQWHFDIAKNENFWVVVFFSLALLKGQTRQCFLTWITLPTTFRHISLFQRAMYKTRNTGTGNGMRGTRGMGGMLYSGECCQTFRRIPPNIPRNVTKYSGECAQTFQGISPNIRPQTFQGMLPNILGNVPKHSGNVAKYSGECPQTFRGMSPNIPGNVLKHSGEYRQTF